MGAIENRRLQAAWSRLAARSDSLGTMVSGLCLVHCVATPVLISIWAAAGRLIPAEGPVHGALAIFVFLFGAAAAAGGYRRHRQAWVPFTMAAGLCCICGAGWLGPRMASEGQETALTVAGSLLMMAGHAANRVCCRRCGR